MWAAAVATGLGGVGLVWWAGSGLGFVDYLFAFGFFLLGASLSGIGALIQGRLSNSRILNSAIAFPVGVIAKACSQGQKFIENFIHGASSDKGIAARAIAELEDGTSLAVAVVRFALEIRPNSANLHEFAQAMRKDMARIAEETSFVENHLKSEDKAQVTSCLMGVEAALANVINISRQKTLSGGDVRAVVDEFSATHSYLASLKAIMARLNGRSG